MFSREDAIDKLKAEIKRPNGEVLDVCYLYDQNCWVVYIDGVGYWVYPDRPSVQFA